jgi:hypothetical protein
MSPKFRRHLETNGDNRRQWGQFLETFGDIWRHGDKWRQSGTIFGDIWGQFFGTFGEVSQPLKPNYNREACVCTSIQPFKNLIITVKLASVLFRDNANPLKT